MSTIPYCTVALLALTLGIASAQSSSPTGEHSTPQQGDSASAQQHLDDVNTHGDMAMGFSHMRTTHHFGLTRSGGFIRVQANDAADTASRDHIRMHLQHTAKAFSAGDFSDPEMTHSRVPPGVPAMRQLNSSIDYKYQETKNGGEVLIKTANPEALKAVHDFLSFQIQDHQTGDPTIVQE